MYMFRIMALIAGLIMSDRGNAEELLDVLSRDYSASELPELSSTDLMRGQFRPVNFTVLSAGMDGRLKQFDVRTGDLIRKGSLIAAFSCDEERAATEIAKARHRMAEKNLEVNQKLDEYKNVSEFDLAMSEGEVDITLAELKRTRAVLSNCEIYAPYNATVTDKLVQAYQYVNKGEPLIEIVDTQNLEIEMVLPSVSVSEYQTGRRFSITIDETGEMLDAEIDRVVNVIDPVSQTVRVIGRLVADSETLMPGMSGVVKLHASGD